MKETVKVYLLCDNYPKSHERASQIIQDFYGTMVDLQIVAFTSFEKPTIDKLSSNGGSIADLQRYLDRHYQEGARSLRR